MCISWKRIFLDEQEDDEVNVDDEEDEDDLDDEDADEEASFKILNFLLTLRLKCISIH